MFSFEHIRDNEKNRDRLYLEPGSQMELLEKKTKSKNLALLL
jgi:hypothetical protein